MDSLRGLWKIKEALIKSAGQIGEQIFRLFADPKLQEYCLYFKILGQKQAENMPSRCAR